MTNCSQPGEFREHIRFSTKRNTFGRKRTYFDELYPLSCIPAIYNPLFVVSLTSLLKKQIFSQLYHSLIRANALDTNGLTKG